MERMSESQLKSGLSTTLGERFQSVSRTETKRRGEAIYKVGDTPSGVYIVKQGLVGLTLLGISGREHLMRLFGPGRFFGHRSLFANEPYHASAVALEPTTLQVIPKDEITKALANDLELYQELLYVLSRELRRCEVQHVHILENQVLSRVAQAVVYLKDLHADHNWTRQEIANFCASTTSTVIKTLAELEERALIRQSGRTIEILDRDGLIALQDE
ncbi:MAG: Crp/Fnr family transcriptional regulator [Bdellovibrionales bacterium]|jgi:CRP-like cAMP-binding protein|nr:Crp/Fnr family transcriptional regulator [Bdellovibrionales bacterium]